MRHTTHTLALNVMPFVLGACTVVKFIIVLQISAVLLNEIGTNENKKNAFVMGTTSCMKTLLHHFFIFNTFSRTLPSENIKYLIKINVVP